MKKKSLIILLALIVTTFTVVFKNYQIDDMNNTIVHNVRSYDDDNKKGEQYNYTNSGSFLLVDGNNVVMEYESSDDKYHNCIFTYFDLPNWNSLVRELKLEAQVGYLYSIDENNVIRQLLNIPVLQVYQMKGYCYFVTENYLGIVDEKGSQCDILYSTEGKLDNCVVACSEDQYKVAFIDSGNLIVLDANTLIAKSLTSVSDVEWIFYKNEEKIFYSEKWWSYDLPVYCYDILTNQITSYQDKYEKAQAIWRTH